MNITIKPWKPGDGGLICLPLRSNIPDASKHPDRCHDQARSNRSDRHPSDDGRKYENRPDRERRI